MHQYEVPEKVSHSELLQVLFNRSVAGMTDDQLVYFLELVQALRDCKEKVDTEVWWNSFYQR